MENKDVTYVDAITMDNEYNKIFIHPIIGNFNESTGRGWFAVSLKDYENQPLENKIFSEEWDIVDATYPAQTKYYTWLKVTYFANKVPVKITYNNGTHRWLGVQDLLNYIKDAAYGNAKFRITELRVKPYKYTDDYGHNRIAGQLQFIGVEWDDNYYPKFSNHVDLPDEIEKKVINGQSKTKIEQMIEDDVREMSEEKAVVENPTISSFDLEHDKPIPEKVDLTPAYDYRKDKLFKLLELIDMEPKEALKILIDCSY